MRRMHQRRRQRSPSWSEETLSDSDVDNFHEIAGGLSDNDMEYGEPISTSIASQIPNKIKRSIWENRYVDMGSLCYHTMAKSQVLLDTMLNSMLTCK